MPTNNFKLFDENKANLLTDTEYANATQRLNGVQTGVASSQLNNKFAYQVSLVAYSIAQLMNANGLDASDTLAVSAFVGNLQGALLQKVADKATTAEAAAGVLSNKYITPETMKAAALLLSGGVMSGMLDMGNNRITNLGTPTADSDAVTKAYVDGNKSKQLSESINISGTLDDTTDTISKNFTKIIDLNEANAIGIKMTFNSDFVITNSVSSKRRLEMNICIGTNEIPIIYREISSGSYTLYNSGMSFFIPIFMYPYNFVPLSSDNFTRSVFSGFRYSQNINDLVTIVERINKDTIDTSDYIQISVTSSLSVNNFNITFDIYKIYF